MDNMKTEKTVLADALAAFAHRGQVDKAGEPYINHPRRVASGFDTEDEITVALLHDVAEDTEITLGPIENIFGSRVAEAVDALTHREDEDYFDYVRRAGQNPVAKAVKLSDLNDNMNLGRLKNVTDKDLKRVEKYRKAKAILEE